MAEERSSSAAGYRVEHHTPQGTAVVGLLVDPDPVAIRCRGEGGVLVLIEDVTNHVVKTQAVQPAAGPESS